MKPLDLTCPKCSRTLRYSGTVTYVNGDKVQEWVCCCGYETEEVIKKGDVKK